MEIKEEKDDIKIVGVRCSDLSVEPLAGSWKATCSECNNEVWITKMWKGKNVKIICEYCCFEDEIHKEDVQLKVTKEVLNEFVKWAREYYGDKIIDKSDDDIKLRAIELIESKVKKEVKVVDNWDLI